MFRRYIFPVVGFATLFVSTAIFTMAQTGELRGKVVLKQADGTMAPATDADVEIYRTDVTGKYATKTNKKGEFVYAGIPYVGDYVIIASREGAQPTWIPGVKAGREIEYKVELSPGSGRRFTPDEIKTIIARAKGSGGAPSAEVKESGEDKAKREELERKNAEIIASNKKAEESNAVIQRSFTSGNAALKLKNYDEAIALFDEGIRADPQHPGAPSLLTNKSAALNGRAVAKFNAAIQSTDDAAKSAGLEAAKKDWKEASEASRKAVDMLKATPAPTDAAAATNAKTNLYYALLTRAEVARFFVTKVDPSQVDAGVTAYEEYIAAETDPAKKLQAQHNLATMLFDANAFDRALSYYQKILETNPDDLDALLRSGQALFNIGAMNNDKAKYQEAADFLARFVEKAPDTNAYKADAKAILETLKSQENVKPAAAPARRRRP